MNKKNVVIFCLFFCLCSPPPEDGIVSLSGDTTTTTTINIEDYPIVLTQCLNEEKGYDIVTPFDIQDLKTTISQLSTSKDEELQLGEDVLEGLVEEEALSVEQADTILNTMAARKLEMKAEREEIKNLIKEMFEDGEITVVELDSVTTIDQEKIDRFKDHFSEELEDGVISEEEFKDNIKSHHRKGHHKSKGNK